MRLSPNNINARENLVTGFVLLGRLDEAEQAAQELQKINPDALTARLSNHFFAYLRRDQATMDREVQWASGRPEEAEFTARLSGIALYEGKAKRAEELQKRLNRSSARIGGERRRCADGSCR